MLPRPQRIGGPRILIGGVGQKRTPDLVSQFADEWNAMFLTPEKFKELNANLDQHLKQAKRDSNSVRRSMMTGCFFAATDSELKRKIESRNKTIEQLHQQGMIAGNASVVRDQLLVLEGAGLQRIMLQWLNLDDLVGLESLAKAVL